MLLCRSAWQRLVPLTQRATTLLRNAPVRQMSASSVPGSSGEALPYYLLVAVSIAGGVAYAYRTVARDRARSLERHEHIKTQVTSKLNSIRDDGVTVETGEISETTVEAVEAAIEEAVAEEVTEQEAVPTTSLEQEQPVAEEEATLSPSEEEPAVSAVASTEQEQENAEPVAEAVAAETSPVLEVSSDNIPEELSSAAEDWAELSARKPEESVEENSDAAQESEEAIESEVAASS